MWGPLKTHQSPVSLDLCLRKTESEKSHDHRDAIFFVKLRFHLFSIHTERKPAFSKFLWFEERFEKLRFRDGLVWTEGVTVEIKLRFHIRRSVDEVLVSLYSQSMLIESKLLETSRDSNHSRQI